MADTSTKETTFLGEAVIINISYYPVGGGMGLKEQKLLHHCLRDDDNDAAKKII